MGNNFGRKRSNTSHSSKKNTIISVSGGDIKGDLNLIGDFEYDDEGLLRFEKKNVLKWKKVDLEQFLKAVDFIELIEKFGETIQSGKDLAGIDIENEVFKDLDKGRRRLFYVYLKHFKGCANVSKKSDNDQYFTRDFHVVLHKLLDGGIDVNDKSFPLDKLESHCSILCSWEKIQKYLLTSKEENEKVLREGEQKLKIKLIITENTFDPKEQLLRKMISPIINVIPKFKQKFGMFHSAILVGQYYLQWTDTAVIIPKKVLSSGSAIISIDTDPITIETKRDLDRVKSSIAKLIAKWNTKYKYVQYGNKKYEGNCQDFVVQVCKELEIDLNIEEGCFRDYLSKIRKKGAYKIEFKPSTEFQRAFKLENYEKYDTFEKNSKIKGEEDVIVLKINFETHKELDDFLYYCYVTNRFAVEKFVSEYRLLKSFDRAFWLRHLKFSEEEKYKPAPADGTRKFGFQQNFICGCPFSDPRATGSYGG